MHRLPLLTLVLLLIGAPVGAADQRPSTGAGEASPGVQGRVEADSSPLEQVTVYAYELAELSMRKVTTGESGAFVFESLPAGIYKLVAFKPGFHPSIVMLSRAAVDAHQFVEIQLQEEEPEDSRQAETYWTVRDEIPPDVLREIELKRLSREGLASSHPGSRSFRGAVEAVTGYDEPGLRQSAFLTGAGIDMEGRIGSLRVGVDGEYLRLAAEDPTAGLTTPEGEAASLALQMQGTGTGRVDLTTVNQRLGALENTPQTVADFERYRISWSQPFGDRSRSRFSAQYVSDSQFYRPRWESGRLPDAGARALRLEGVYELEISDRTSVETGVRYREHVRDTGSVESVALGLRESDDRTLELFGRSGIRLAPKVLVEYGLYTQLRDGSMALAPQGELVLQLTPRWQAIGTVSQRIEDGERPETWYWAPVPMEAASRACDGLEEHCYRLVLARDSGEDETFSVSATHREMAEDLRIHFDDDLFRQMESLYLTRGDELPEVQVVAQRRISPQVLARVASTYAEGGGGLIYAVDEGAHENRVRYLVTSVDTRFPATSTGVFVAFHHLRQSLDPTGPRSSPTTTLDLERLQLMLSQDLNLLQAATDLALHLNFEISRGDTPYSLEPSEALRRRLTGGVSVRF